MLEGEKKLEEEVAARKERELLEAMNKAKVEKKQLAKVIKDVRDTVTELGGRGVWDGVEDGGEEVRTVSQEERGAKTRVGATSKRRGLARIRK